MDILKSARRLSFGALLLSATFFAGCGAPLDGTFETSQGGVSITFDSGHAYIKTLGGTIETAYEVNGDKIILKSPTGNLVLTRNDDGTLSGPMGTLSRHATAAGGNEESGHTLSGTYAMSNNRGGLGSIKFDGGRAYVYLYNESTGATATLTTTYEVEGNKVIIKDPQGGGSNLVLTRNADGTLSDATGKILRKQGS
ncbi:MAG: hypothetical protein L0I62_06640 [Gammaproteobacteria bacterium]|nr:hypothetical protein [Gammaproteobacteria bacterium]